MTPWATALKLLEALVSWLERRRLEQIVKKRQDESDDTYTDAGAAFDRAFGRVHQPDKVDNSSVSKTTKTDARDDTPPDR